MLVVMIRSFRDQQTENIFRRNRVKGFSQDVQRGALRKLVILDAAETLDDLRVPPGNRLEKLKGDRKGEYSIRVNDQWRVCFVWSDGDAQDVELTDYHQESRDGCKKTGTSSSWRDTAVGVPGTSWH